MSTNTKDRPGLKNGNGTIKKKPTKGQRERFGEIEFRALSVVYLRACDYCETLPPLEGLHVSTEIANAYSIVFEALKRNA